MTLNVDGTCVEVAQATPTHLYLRVPAKILSGTGEPANSINGAITRQSVELLNRDQLSSIAVPFERIG